MKTAAQRIEHFNNRADATLLGNAYTAQVTTMKANYAAHVNDLVPIQESAKSYLDTQGVTPNQYFSYMAFVNELYRATKSAAGETLFNELMVLICSYVGFGLSCAILEGIATDVFTIAISPTDCFIPGPVLLSPADGAADQAVDGTLTWQCVGCATLYDVYLSTEVDGGDTPIQSDVATCSYDYTGLTNGETYYWKVVGKGTCCDGAESEIWSFDVIAL